MQWRYCCVLRPGRILLLSLGSSDAAKAQLTIHSEHGLLTYMPAQGPKASPLTNHITVPNPPRLLSPPFYLIVLLVLGLLSFSVPLAIHYPGRISYQRAKTPTLEDMDKWVLRGGSRGTEDMGYFLDVGWCEVGGGGGGGGAGGGGGGGRIWSC